MTPTLPTGRIRRRGDALEAVLRLPDGRRVTRATGCKLGQEREAEAFLAALLAELSAVTPARTGGPSVRAWGEAWAQARIDRKVVSADGELAHLRYHFFPQLGDLPLAGVTREAVLDWVRSLQGRPRADGDGPLAPRTVHHIAGTVRRMFAEAVDAGRIPSSPCTWRAKRDLPRKVDKVAGKRNRSGFDGWEVHALVTDARIPLDRRVMWAFDFLTGMRPGEVAVRRWKDLDTTTTPLWRLEVATAYNSRHYVEKSTKTNVEKIVPLHPLLADLLRVWFAGGWKEHMGRAPKPDDLIIPREQGGPRTTSHSNKRFQGDLDKLGLRGGRSHYETRATFRSLAIAGDAPEKALDLITHPSPRDASDLYTRIEQVWPAMCRAVLAVRVEPRLSQGSLEGAVATPVAACLQPFDPEKEKARRLSGLGPISGVSQYVGDAGLEPATPAV